MQQIYDYQVLHKNSGQVIIQLNETLLNLILQHFPLAQTKAKSTKELPLNEKKMHNFQRRIVPFFMNQFMHWAEQMNYKQVDGYLRTIHRKKTSKQQKFELGDLKKLFGPINPRTKLIQTETQHKWIDFLQSQAEVSVLLNNKIKDSETKRLYIEAIQSLKEELSKEQPYDKFLSLTKKDSDYQTEYSHQTTDEYYEVKEEEEPVYNQEVKYYEDPCDLINGW